MLEWQRHQRHEDEIIDFLRERKCMDNKRQIRRWRSDNWKGLNELGHTSLSFKECQCRHDPKLDEEAFQG